MTRQQCLRVRDTESLNLSSPAGESEFEAAEVAASEETRTHTFTVVNFSFSLHKNIFGIPVLLVLDIYDLSCIIVI